MKGNEQSIYSPFILYCFPLDHESLVYALSHMNHEQDVMIRSSDCVNNIRYMHCSLLLFSVSSMAPERTTASTTGVNIDGITLEVTIKKSELR